MQLFTDQPGKIVEYPFANGGKVIDLYLHVDHFSGFGKHLDIEDSLFVPLEEAVKEGINDGEAAVFLIGDIDDRPEQAREIVDISRIGKDAFKDLIGEG
jgi:hypothetical protein